MGDDVRPGAPPFLILHGNLDTDVPIRQSETLAQQLRAAGVPTTFVEVRGTAHTLNTPGQEPTPEQITAMVVDFFTTTLH
ncbi:alpha/beta hydrolase [Micromonospora sp. NPDC005806]|uniref:alpha/beta hydrolase n=1 Tax=Micromonospora sp. NPDC005806 TaxID=3364234 RepID=UPI0036905E3A